MLITKKILYWLFIAFIFHGVGSHLLYILNSGSYDLELFYTNQTCLNIVPYFQYVFDLNIVLGILALVSILFKSKYTIPLLFVYLLVHVVSCLPTIYYYNFRKFETVWPEWPYIWEALLLGWPVIAIAATFTPSIYNKLKHDNQAQPSTD